MDSFFTGLPPSPAAVTLTVRFWVLIQVLVLALSRLHVLKKE